MHIRSVIAFLILLSLSHIAAADPLPPELPPVPAEAPLPPPPDYFRDALVSVYNNQPQLKAQREAVKAEDENVSQAISGFRPDISAGYDKGRERLRLDGQPWNTGNSTDKTFTATQDIFNGGESWASFKSSRERVRAARAQLTDTEQQVLYNAVAAYTDVVAKRLVLQANQNNVDVLEKQLSDTEARFDVGDLTRTDIAQSQSRLAQAVADERQALGALDTARGTFRRIIGYDPPENVELPPLPPGLPQGLDEAVAIAQDASPSLEIARRLETAAGNDIDVRTASLFPDVSIQGSMNRSDGPSTVGTRSIDNDAITLNISIPLYQSGAEWSRIRQAKNQAQQAKFTALDTHDAVLENITRAWHDFQTAQAVIASTAEAAKAAEVALEGVREENLAGARTVLDRLNAEQELFAARVNLVNAQALEKTQAYRLLAAVGKLTARNLGLPVDVYDPKAHYDDVKYRLLGF